LEAARAVAMAIALDFDLMSCAESANTTKSFVGTLIERPTP
jgi:hypothetical protein